MANFSTEELRKRCVEYNVLKAMTEDLCKALPIDGLFPSMISNHVIDYLEKKEICAEKTEVRKVQYFLDHYLSKGLDCEEANTDRFYQFLKVMQASPKCTFLMKKINNLMKQFKEYSAKPGEATLIIVQNKRYCQSFVWTPPIRWKSSHVMP